MALAGVREDRALEVPSARALLRVFARKHDLAEGHDAIVDRILEQLAGELRDPQGALPMDYGNRIAPLDGVAVVRQLDAPQELGAAPTYNAHPALDDRAYLNPN